jgi:class 3 adenylate cyclase
MYFGIHLYVCLNNLFAIAESAEKNGYIRKVFFSMDLLLCQLDKWVKDNCPKNVYIEKLTGSRIHFVINTNNQNADCRYFWDIVNYSYGLLDELNEATKIASLSDDYQMCMGADVGLYINSPIHHGDVKEENSIGNPANKAAKIQSYAEPGWLYVTEELENYLQSGACHVPFNNIQPEKAYSLDRKYHGIHVSKVELSMAARFLQDSRSFFAGNSNPFTDFAAKLNDRNLSSYSPVTIDNNYHFSGKTNNPKKIDPGYVLYCDIRGSTKLVASYASQIQFADLVTAIMEKIYSMIDAVQESKMDHVQVQGDRESAMLIVGSDKKSAARRLIKCAFQLQGSDFKTLFERYKVDFKTFPLSVGIGISYGTFFLSSVGTRADSENLLLGSVVNDADDAEDNGAANPNTIALTKAAFDSIVNCGDSSFANVVNSCFELNDSRTYYVNKVGKDGYLQGFEKERLDNNAKDAQSKGIKPWAP